MTTLTKTQIREGNPMGHSEAIPTTLHALADEVEDMIKGIARRGRDEIRLDVLAAQERRFLTPRPASPALAAELMKRNARPKV